MRACNSSRSENAFASLIADMGEDLVRDAAPTGTISYPFSFDCLIYIRDKETVVVFFERGIQKPSAARD